MRVISGSAKGTRLISVPGKTTRPITDQVKEALFNILATDIVDSLFLDLFAGTGAVGIEALSRGGAHAVFLDINHRAFSTIKENLRTTNLQDYATVSKKDAFTYLKEDSEQSFDFIYIAPPQYKDYWLQSMKLLDINPGLLQPDGSIIVQIHPKEYQEINYTNLLLDMRRDYGDTILLFFGRNTSE